VKLRHLFTINLPIALFFGLSCTIFPAWVLGLYGLPPDEGARWATRLVGGSILGYATLMWYGRKAAPPMARRAIALTLLVQDAIGFLASVVLLFTGAANALNWTNILLYGLLGAGYAWFRFVTPEQA
jgi:hypothetical protein